MSRALSVNSAGIMYYRNCRVVICLFQITDNPMSDARVGGIVKGLFGEAEMVKGLFGERTILKGLLF